MNESLAEKIRKTQDGDTVLLIYEELKEIQEMLSTQPEFKGFSKIPRLNREIIITEKIDGTNAQIAVTQDGRIFPGSRKRWLTVEKDNYGFAAWVHEHEEELLQLGPGRHFGEWWGKGINRGYGLDHRRFSLFNVSRWIDQHNPIGVDWWLDKSNKQQRAPYCCYVVPILESGECLDTECLAKLLYRLKINGSVAAPGFMNLEGIVIYHTAGNHLYKVTLENDEKPKGKNDA